MPTQHHTSSQWPQQTTPESDSAIGQHFSESNQCPATTQFAILEMICSQFHLSLLEVTYIKISHPNLCRQKEFVYSLILFK